MKRVLQVLTAVLLLNLCLISGAVGWFLCSHRAQFNWMVDETVRQEKVAGGILSNTEQALRAWKRSSEDQSILATESLKNTNAMLLKFRTAADHLTATIDTTNVVMQHLDAAAQKVGTDLDSTNANLQPILVNLGTSSEALARQTPVILRNLEVTSQQSAQIAKNVEGMTNNLELSAHDLQTVTHEWTKPEKGLWHGVKAAINLTWSIRGALGF